MQVEHRDIVEWLTKLLEQTIANGRSTLGRKQANDVPIVVNKANVAASKE